MSHLSREKLNALDVAEILDLESQIQLFAITILPQGKIYIFVTLKF